MEDDGDGVGCEDCSDGGGGGGGGVVEGFWSWGFGRFDSRVAGEEGASAMD